MLGVRVTRADDAVAFPGVAECQRHRLSHQTIPSKRLRVRQRDIPGGRIDVIDPRQEKSKGLRGAEAFVSVHHLRY